MSQCRCRCRCVNCGCNIEGLEDAGGTLHHPSTLQHTGQRRVSKAGHAYYLCADCMRLRSRA